MLQFDPFKCNAMEKHTPESDKEDIAIEVVYSGIPLRPQSLAMVGVRKLLFARSFAQFDQALSVCSKVISLNFAYADIEGHIGYCLTGEVPRRGGKRGSELLPLLGWTGDDDWVGFVRHEDLPKAFDPPSG